MRRVAMICCLAATMSMAGCSTVPKEVVELSYTTGQDLQAVHTSYQALIRNHFDNLRLQTNSYLDNKWIPAFLSGAIKEGDLVGLAKNPDPVEVYNGVSAWVELTVEKIEQQRKLFIDPINSDEKELLASVDDSFAKLMWANTTVTAHLNSLRKVQEVQDQALKSLEIKNFRDKFMKQLAATSERASSAIKDVEKLQNKVPELERKKDKLLGKKGDDNDQ